MTRKNVRLSTENKSKRAQIIRENDVWIPMQGWVIQHRNVPPNNYSGILKKF